MTKTKFSERPTVIVVDFFSEALRQQITMTVQVRQTGLPHPPYGSSMTASQMAHELASKMMRKGYTTAAVPTSKMKVIVKS